MWEEFEKLQKLKGQHRLKEKTNPKVQKSQKSCIFCIVLTIKMHI